jgi:enoyl-CoA hydratase
MGGEFTSDVLTIDRDDAVATLWLDRPEAGNAMGPAFWADLPRAMAELSLDDEIRAVVLAARGRHFSVGLDLKALDAISPDEDAGGAGDGSAPRRSVASRARSSLRAILRLQASITSVADCTKPMIAAVHGSCIGGGVDLIAACDIRLASADTLLSVREAKMAIVADLGSLQRLPRIIGAGHVAELAFTAKDISADRAREIGLVNAVLADAEAAVEAARTMASEIAANSPLAVQGAKAVLSAGDGLSVAQGLDYVATWNAAMLASDDLTEAMAAFMEKRPPRYTGT